MQYPEQLTPALSEVLGTMTYKTSQIADLYREAGHNIPKTYEDEHAFILHRYIKLALIHGDAWRDHAKNDIRTEHAKIKEPTP